MIRVVPIVGATIACAATSAVTVPVIVILCTTTQTAVIGGILGGIATSTAFYGTKKVLTNKYLK